MKAARFDEFGGIEGIRIVDIPQPELEDGRLLIRVRAASLNPSDTSIRTGAFQKNMPLQLPATLGGDFAGIVEQVAEGFAVGDEVYGQASALLGASGSLAEYAVTSLKTVARKPASVDFLEAASLPLVGVSVIQALIEHMHLRPGQKILIHGGAGGIGSLAVQLAKHLGAYVATTVAPAEQEFAHSLGADLVIDYTSEKFEDQVHDFDAVHDTVGGETYRRSFAVLKKGGIIVSMLEEDKELAAQHGVTAIRQLSLVTTARLEKLADLVDEGAIKVKVDKVFPLDETAEAFQYRETGMPRGKVVVAI
jgi:NADPH:quinone reductase-like Zn-dependent oxidoreductase